MSRESPWRAVASRALLCLLVLGAAAAALFTIDPRLGLDLRGGTQFTLQAGDEANPATVEDTDATLEVLRGRVDSLGVAEPVLVRAGDDRIVVELPGVTDPAEAAEVLGRTAQLTIHPVQSARPDPALMPGSPPPAANELPDEAGNLLQLAPAALTGAGITDATPGRDPMAGPGSFVDITFSSDAAPTWQQVTAQAACAAPGDPARRVAIVLDGTVISSPGMVETISCGAGIPGGRTQITGQFSADEARELAILIRGGSLPVPVEIIEQRTVGPTLGAAAIEASVQAVALGAAATGVFLLIMYKAAGAVALLALAGYGLISAAALLGLGATVTLPGLAGFVLAVGMAVDANVLVFERAREDWAAQPSTKKGREGRLRRVVDGGFRGAFSAIADAGATTLIAAGLLVWLAAGPVRGFGVTLAVGVVVSLFSALVLTGVLLRLLVTSGPLSRRPRWSGLDGPGRVRRALNARPGLPDALYRLPARWVAISAAVAVLGLAGPLVRGLDLGIEFTGGRLLSYEQVPADLDPELVRTALADAGEDRAVVSLSDAGLDVRTPPIDEAERAGIDAAVAGVLGVADITAVRDELVGPSLGRELARQALLALALAIAAQLVYLAVRFDWRLGAATVMALVADSAVLIGAMSWFGRPVDGIFLAAALTTIGYSVNDSVVVFDRVREMRGQRRTEPFVRVAAAAVIQTLPRTVATGAGVAFVLVALLLFGGGALTDLAFALLVGLIAGTLSTITLAAPLAVLIDRRWPGAGRPNRKPARVREGNGAVV
ncbi:protein translocase subunit SecD [Pseudonocardia bannensis]|uniref:Multifunctional fusion protein n=1 Tax=Pseudonocardia bannensis TaxID=630973 RepID=A0A848DE31_9PSEU|nr:protein translocase subunit SecD [Pseudonocardia bannensis]NMH90846.1 protein translocase subunit SecD [Pseudonocardia bannensis]